MLLNWEGYSYLFLRATGVSPNQLLTILQPYAGRFPNTQQEFEDMTLAVRRMARIIEGHPGNLAQSLQAPANMFATPDQQNPQDGGPNGVAYPTWNSYGQHPAWNNYQPMGLGAADPMNAAPPWQAAGSAQNPAGQYSGYNNQQSQDPGYNYQSIGEDSGTESDTSSDYEDYDQADYNRTQYEPAVANMTPEQQDHHYWQTYRSAKRNYRSHFRKPTRRVRRFAKRRGFGRKGKGRGKHRFHFLSQLPDEEYDTYFGSNKGKGKRGRSSGKGKGRRRNPTGRDGQVMKCDVVLPNGQVCGSETHLRADHARLVGTSGYHSYKQ